MCSLILAGGAFAADGWETTLKVKVGVAEGKIRIGQRADATDGVDGRYDVPAYVAGNETLLAYTVLGNAKYWRDVKAYCADTCVGRWPIVIESTLIGKTVVITWDTAALPKDMSVSLVDSETGAAIDMKVKSELQYQNRGKHEFKVEAVR